jgi:hypothetical protein
VNVSDIIDNLSTNMASKPLSAAQGVALKSLIDTLDRTKLAASALTSAIETALADAKASGKFDGVGIAKIEQTSVSALTDGYTITYTNGKTFSFYVTNGANGTNGKDGTSPTVAVSKSGKVTTIDITDKNGTKTATVNDGADGSSVSVSNVSESTASGGSNVVTFSDGKKLTVKNGTDGKDGDDYVLTAADKQEIVESVGENYKGAIAQLVIAELQGLPVFGVVDENNIITVTSQLSGGTYTLKYENEGGVLEEIGTIVVGGGNSDNSVTEVDLAAIGYTDNARWSLSEGTIRTGVAGYTAINIIPFTRPSGKTVIMELSGIDWIGGSSDYHAVLPYNGDTFLANCPFYLREPIYYADTGFQSIFNDDGSVTVKIFDPSTATGVKLCGYGSGADAKITIRIE